jgi:hypothetical protein
MTHYFGKRESETKKKKAVDREKTYLRNLRNGHQS